ncbi:DNA topoisomerase 1 [bioreactor metagenome]|uniref:DNA topoisomerase n=1 Tax=bioreactor metagenome TaxID=1076179 RepID=A0A644T5N0_9ZZZZ|nr:type I DNA topoisomerase [Candidatus Elulimicrobiales bacterium]
MKLLIVESPSKAKTIEKYLGKDYTVRASVGHIRDLPKSNKKALDIENGFIPNYEVVKGKEKVISEIKSLSKKADEVILATDPDREGEAIAWHVKEAIGLKKPKRAVFNEVTKEAILEALKNPRDIDMDLKEAQEARRVLDRLVGYELSGIIWKKVRYGLSAGRVQSPALRIIMEREREIRNFIPVKYFNIAAELETVGKLKESKKYKLVFDCELEPGLKPELNSVEAEELAKKIVKEGKAGTWYVKDVKETNAKSSPKPPFTTSTLQQTASSRLGFAPKKTMMLAQKLYEKGYITYMRTDSTNLASSAIAEISSFVSKKYGKDYLETRAYKTKSKNAQEAHEAIRPTHISTLNAGTTSDEKRLYALIWNRTVASQMSDAKLLRTKIIANIKNKKDYPDFFINGSIVLFDGWLKVDPDGKGEDILLPKLEVEDSLTLNTINSISKETLPPGRYSEASLIKELEKRDIGRPSTYASIVSTIEDRGYVEKINKALIPTDTGEVVSDFLEQNFAKYISDDFTSEMEDDLDKIAEGKLTYKKLLTDFYKPFQKEIKEKDKLEKTNNFGEAPKDIKCPVCNSKMIVKLSRSGKFYSCSKFPDCSGARTLEGEIMEGPKETGKICPKCEKGKLIERTGRYGKFIACANYPKCKYIEVSEEEKQKKNTGVKCNKCDDGYLEERRGRFGVFYSCSNYPDCKLAIKAKPTGNYCNMCGELMMEGTKTIPERCSSKTCPNHNPHKLNKK